MKKTILFLLLAWIAIYAGNHLLFKSIPKNSEVETALRSQPDQGGERLSFGGRTCREFERRMIRSRM